MVKNTLCSNILSSYLRVMVASLQLFSSPVLFECSRVDARLQTVSNLSYKCSIIRHVGDAEVFDGARRKLVVGIINITQ